MSWTPAFAGVTLQETFHKTINYVNRYFRGFAHSQEYLVIAILGTLFILFTFCLFLTNVSKKSRENVKSIFPHINLRIFPTFPSSSLLTKAAGEDS